MFRQHFVGVFAKVWRGRAHLERRAGELDRLPHQFDIAQFGMLRGCRHAEMFDLRVREHFVDGVDVAGRHAGFVECGDPFAAGARSRDGFDLQVHGVAVARTLGGRFVARIGQPILATHCGAETLVDGGAGSGDVDVAILGTENAGGYAGGMVVARLRRHFLMEQPTLGLEIQHGHLRLQQGRANPLAFAGLRTRQQRGHHTQRREQAGGEIGHRNASAYRPLAGQSGYRHQAAHALGHLVEAGQFAVRPILPEP